MYILLVDDDPLHRRALAVLLRGHCGALIAHAENGREALETLRVFPADLIVTDCQMPQMDGLTFTRTLRARGRQCPVIMLSGQPDPEVVDTALSAGVTHYLHKPVSPRDLLSKIAHYRPCAEPAA